MKYFKDVLTVEELKSVYRRLAMLYHPDRGGNIDEMKKINSEYSELSKEIGKTPDSFMNIRVGNTIYVNRTKCIVTSVERSCFMARSLETCRETYFSKSTGYAMLNFKYKASLCKN
ncbi:MAG: J domain-containing protein [Bacteroidales bacterium]|nr:J domain-containing protein [Bacteroidales bacterium]